MNAERKKSPIGVLFLTVFVDLVGFSIIFPLFPDMLEHYAGADSFFGGLIANLAELSGEQGEKRDFYTTVLFGGILGSLYSILQFLFAPMWGRLSDRIGRRPVLLMTIGGLCVSYLVWIFSGSFLLLIISRVLGGAMGGNISVATAAMADSTDEKNRAKGMGMIGMAFGLGFILGPAIGALLSNPSLDIQSWGLPGLNPFSTAAAGAFLLSLWNLSWVMRSFKESLPEEERGKAHRAGRPISPLKLFRGFDIPGVSRTNMVYFLFLVAFAGMEFTLTFLAKDRLNYTSHDMMWIFIFVGLIIALVQGGVVRRMAPKLGEKKVTLCGLILLVPGLLITGTAQTGGMFYLGLAFLAVGSALATPLPDGSRLALHPLRPAGRGARHLPFSRSPVARGGSDHRLRGLLEAGLGIPLLRRRGARIAAASPGPRAASRSRPGFAGTRRFRRSGHGKPRGAC